MRAVVDAQPVGVELVEQVAGVARVHPLADHGPIAERQPDEDPVDAADERRGVRGALGPAVARRERTGGDEIHQSLTVGAIAPAAWWKYCSNTFNAAGAAAEPPWPPFSMSAQTVIVGLSAGA